MLLIMLIQVPVLPTSVRGGQTPARGPDPARGRDRPISDPDHLVARVK